MMARYINADDCINTVDQSDLDEGIKAIVKSVIRNTKTADAVEVKRGKWSCMQDGEYSCTNCKEMIAIDVDFHPIDDCEIYYCPYCGADMKGGAE